MRRLSVVLVTAVFVVASAPTAVAQGTPRQPVEGTGVIVGSIVTTGTGEPVRADVTIERPRRAA